jgi:hypothetical protein
MIFPRPDMLRSGGVNIQFGAGIKERSNSTGTICGLRKPRERKEHRDSILAAEMFSILLFVLTNEVLCISQ